MTHPPTILVLEDERPQLLAVRASLRGLGEIQEFTDPTSALAYVKRHGADAAIVDIHMPEFHVNGMEFIRSVRAFDRDLSVIIRTGDDSTELADDAIEVSAFRRAIKGRTTIDELRSLTADAIVETRTRRQITRDAANTATVKTQWAQTLGSFEEAVTVGDNYHGFFLALRNRLTAIAGVSTLIEEAAKSNRTDLLAEYAPKAHQLVTHLLAEVSRFIDSPFSASPQNGRAGQATANNILEATRRHFIALPNGSADRRSLHVAALNQDMRISAPALPLLTAIRHLVEFCRERIATDAAIQLTADYIDDPRRAIESFPKPRLTFTERPVSDGMPCVVFRVSGVLVSTSLEDVKRALEEYPEDPRSGNLQMIPLSLRSELAAFVVRNTRDEVTLFELFVPVSR